MLSRCFSNKISALELSRKFIVVGWVPGLLLLLVLPLRDCSSFNTKVAAALLVFFSSFGLKIWLRF